MLLCIGSALAAGGGDPGNRTDQTFNSQSLHSASFISCPWTQLHLTMIIPTPTTSRLYSSRVCGLDLENKTKNRNRPWPRRAELGIPKGERGGSRMSGHFGGFFGWLGGWHALGVFWTVIFGMDGQWDLTVQHRAMCVIVSLCCTTDKTL